MGSMLQRVMSEVPQLTPEEQWQLLGYLMLQLKPRFSWSMVPQSAGEPTVELAGVDALLEEAKGCWGYASIEEIDAELQQQRQNDWGD